MRVLVLTSQFPNAGFPNRATFNRQHLGALAQKHELELICPISWVERRQLGWGRALELASDTVSLPVTYPTYWYPPGILRRTYGHCLQWSVGSHLLRRARAFRPDVILAVWAYPEGAVAVRLGRRLGLPVAVQVLGSDINLLDDYRSRKAATYRALTAADLVLPVSRALAERVVMEGMKERRVRVVYRGVDGSLFQPHGLDECRRELGLDASRQILLFAGNLVPVKAVDVLISAFARANWNAPTELHVLGSGPLKASLEQLAARLGCAGSVHFHGVVEHAQLPKWYAAANLLALPSLSEGVPNVLLEARSCGKAYVASEVGGIPEVSDHPLARLVPPGDVNAWSVALAEHMRWAAQCSAPAPWRSWTEAGDDLADALAGLAPGVRE